MNAKLIRGQLRQIVQETLPEILNSVVFKDIQRKNEEKLITAIKRLEEMCEKLDARQKDINSLVIREMAKIQPRKEGS